MEGVRTKYKEVFGRIIEAVTEAHPELDNSKVYATQFWGPGSIGVGRKCGPAGIATGHRDFGFGIYAWKRLYPKIPTSRARPSMFCTPSLRRSVIWISRLRKLELCFRGGSAEHLQP